MGLEFIGRVIRTSAVLATLILIFGSVYYEWIYALGISIGLLFNCANVWLMMELVKKTVTPGDRRLVPAIGLALVKFPVLYLAGYLILVADFVPVVSLLIGFTLLFAVIVLKVLGRQLVASRRCDLAHGRRGVDQ